MRTNADDAKRTVLRMIESLTVIRTNAATFDNRTYDITKMGPGGPYAVPAWGPRCTTA